MRYAALIGLVVWTMLPLDSIYDFTMKTLDGKDLPFENLKGKVLMAVNVASR